MLMSEARPARAPTDIKSNGKTGRPPRYASESNVRDTGYILSRCNRQALRGLPTFAIAIAIFREFTQAEIEPPVKLGPEQRRRLEANLAEGAQELEEELGRPPSLKELARYVASWYPPRDPLRRRAEKQIERALKEATEREYWSGVPAQYIPHTGKAGRPATEAFWRWYNATFHGR
jgi:hypothetical protein